MRELIAQGYDKLGDLRSAQPHLEKSYEIRKKDFGEDHRDTVRVLQRLAIAYQANGDGDRAATCFRQVLACVRRGVESPPAFTITLRGLARAFRNEKKYVDAEPLIAESVERLSKEMPGTANLMDDQRELAEVREAQGKFAEAEPLRVELVAYGRQGRGVVELDTSLADLGWNLLGQRKYAEAESRLRECVTIFEQKHSSHWERFHATSLLGAALAGQKKFADAEPLLIAGCEGLRTHLSVEHADWRQIMTDALERLVQLYDAWDKKDRADQWRKKLDEAKTAPKASAQP